MLNLVVGLLASGVALYLYRYYTTTDWRVAGEGGRPWHLIVLVLLLFNALTASANFVTAAITFANGEWI